MELLQSLLNNPLNLDLISYPCSEQGFLACDPGITSAAQLWVSAVCLKTGQRRLLSSSRNSSYRYVELSSACSVMAKQAQLFTSRYIIPNWKHAHVSGWSRREVKRARGARWSGFPQSRVHSYIFICILTNVPVVENKAQGIKCTLWAGGG